MDPVLLVVLITAFALLFDLANGWNDAANAIATVVGTRVMSPISAVIFGAVMNFLGALVSGAVAKTVGADIVDQKTLTSAVGPLIFMAAVAAAPIWITLCTWKGLPISCSHSLMGALVGAALAAGGAGSLKGPGIKKIVYGIFTSPVTGFVFGLLIVVAIAWLFRSAKPRLVKRLFGKLQIISAGAMAFSHGTGDAQKAMGIITGAMIAVGWQSADPRDFHIEPWVRFSCAGMMGIGTIVGGWKVIKTLGSRLGELKAYQGFAAETAGAGTILFNTLTGVPISTTHSITGAIMGTTAAQGIRVVRWSVGKKILYAWVLTFPVCIGMGALTLALLRAALLK